MTKKNDKPKKTELIPPITTTPRSPAPRGFYSNQAITRRNGGVRHQFLDDIGGCSANYR